MGKQDLRIVKELDFRKLRKKQKVSITVSGLLLFFIVFSLKDLLGIVSLRLPNSLVIIPIAMFVIVAHELAHGTMFKVFTGVAKFGFRLHSGIGVVFYTTCPGKLLTRNRMIAVTTAPQVITVAIIIALALMQNGNGWLSYPLLMAAAFNLSGGCADLFSIVQLLKYKGNIFVEDTATGAVIYEKREPETEVSYGVSYIRKESGV